MSTIIVPLAVLEKAADDLEYWIGKGSAAQLRNIMRNTEPEASFKLTADGAAAVATDFYLRPTDQATPRGTLLLLANEDAGVTQKGIYDGDPFWTHWAPMPKFPPKERK